MIAGLYHEKIPLGTQDPDADVGLGDWRDEHVIGDPVM